MSVVWRDHIESDPKVLRGKPHIKGTRIPVSLVLGYLAAGHNREPIIAELPDLKQEQIAACLDYARELSEAEQAEAIQAYDAAKTAGDEAIPFEQAVREIDRDRP